MTFLRLKNKRKASAPPTFWCFLVLEILFLCADIWMKYTPVLFLNYHWLFTLDYYNFYLSSTNCFHMGRVGSQFFRGLSHPNESSCCCFVFVCLHRGTFCDFNRDIFFLFIFLFQYKCGSSFFYVFWELWSMLFPFLIILFIFMAMVEQYELWLPGQENADSFLLAKWVISLSWYVIFLVELFLWDFGN